MRFRVTGQNKETGARQALEFEAESKGAAERKAMQQGMTVNRVEDISDGGGPNTGVDYDTASRGRKTGLHPILKLIILIAILVLAYLFVWPRIKGMF